MNMNGEFSTHSTFVDVRLERPRPNWSSLPAAQLQLNFFYQEESDTVHVGLDTLI